VKLALSFVLLFALSGCPRPMPGPSPVTVDAGTDTPCATYCQLADTQLHCKFAAPTAAGAGCMDVCRNSNDPGGVVRWDFSCRLSQTSCADIAKCL
jgi:hypothetical protein